MPSVRRYSALFDATIPITANDQRTGPARAGGTSIGRDDRDLSAGPMEGRRDRGRRADAAEAAAQEAGQVGPRHSVGPELRLRNREHKGYVHGASPMRRRTHCLRVGWYRHRTLSSDRLRTLERIGRPRSSRRVREASPTKRRLEASSGQNARPGGRGPSRRTASACSRRCKRRAARMGRAPVAYLDMRTPGRTDGPGCMEHASRFRTISLITRDHIRSHQLTIDHAKTRA